jgi:hypothetical protein
MAIAYATGVKTTVCVCVYVYVCVSGCVRVWVLRHRTQCLLGQREVRG